MEPIDYVGALIVASLAYLLIAAIEAIWIRRHEIGDEARDTLYELTHRH
jgi:hypothetical protein